MTRVIAFVLAFLGTAIATPAMAHDNWLEIEPFALVRPNKVKVYLFTGEHFTEAEPLQVRRRDTYTTFRVLSSAGARDIASELREDQAPLASFGIGTAPGSYIVQLEAAPKTIELTAKHFEEYLLEERLVEILMIRAMSDKEETPGRERYSRSLKAITQVGPNLDPFVTQPMGATLEIVPLAHPYGITVGASNASLTIQVLFKGKPLGGRAVMAANRYRKAVDTKTIRTDANGKATFPIRRAGDWMFRLVHMEGSSEADVDWRSYWTSLTFSLHES